MFVTVGDFRKQFTYLIPLAFLSFGYQLMYAQVDGFVPSHWPEHKTFAGLNYTPVLAYRTLMVGDSETAQLAKNYRDETETPMISHSFGLNFRLKRFRDPFRRDQRIKGMCYEIGIRHTPLRYVAKINSLIPSSEEPNLPQQSKIVTTYRYIQIPISVGLFKTVSAWTSYGLIGLSPNIKTGFFQNQTWIYLNGDEKTKPVESDVSIRPITLSAQGSAGIEYESGHGLYYFIEPFFQYDLTFSSNGAIRERLWSTGIRLGFRLQI